MLIERAAPAESITAAPKGAIQFRLLDCHAYLPFSRVFDLLGNYAVFCGVDVSQ